MPGLTVATGANPAAVPASAPEGHRARSTSGPHTHTITTTASNGVPPISSRTSSPTRPPISPITPTLGPSQLAHNHNHNPNIPPSTTQQPLAPPPIPQPKPDSSVNHNVTPVPIPDFALGRPAFTHSTHPPQQTSIQPPPAQPIIDFENNPDVLALKSSITILQLQRARATADMQALSRAKTAALADPEAFVADLAAGRISMGDNAPTLFGSATGAAPNNDRMDVDVDVDDDDDDDDDDDEEEEEDYSSSDSDSDSDGEDSEEGDGRTKIKQEEGTTPPPRTRGRKKKGKKGGQAGPAAWRQLPKPQNVVRCPPINWSQYGVIGESLDKLHAEQVAAPTPGAPVVLDQGGTYEFKAGDTSGEKARRLVGIAAPYVPGRDKLDKKGKGGRR